MATTLIERSNTLDQVLSESPEFQTMLYWMVQEVDVQKTQLAETPDEHLPIGKSRDEIEAMIHLKVLHTWDVIQAMWDILAAIEMPHTMHHLITALTHDAKRFEQARLGSFSDSETNFNHAQKGADFFSNHAPDVFRPDVLSNITKAILLHSEKTVEKGHHLTDNIRLADKLGILRRVQFYLEFDSDRYSDEKKLTPQAFQQFLNGECISHEHVKTRADKILCYMSWLFDMPVEVTRIIKSENIIRILIKELHDSVAGQDIHKLSYIGTILRTLL